MSSVPDSANEVFRHRPDIPLIDRIKIQSEVLVPLIKALEQALGRPAAHEVVRSGVGEYFRTLAENLAAERGSRGALGALGELCSAGNSVEGEVLENSDTAFSFDIVGCRFAEFFREIGEPEIGFLLVCSSDYPMTDGLPGIELERTQTIMQGARTCDFRYRFAADDLQPARSTADSARLTNPSQSQ